MLVHGTNQTGSSYAQSSHQTSLWGRQPAADHSRARHLLALGIYGIVQVNRLGPAVDVILRENYRSVLAMQRGKEALEHQDTGAPYALLGETESSTELRAEYSGAVPCAGRLRTRPRAGRQPLPPVASSHRRGSSVGTPTAEYEQFFRSIFILYTMTIAMIALGAATFGVLFAFTEFCDHL